MTRSFSLTPHEEDLLERITRVWYGDRTRSYSATIGRMLRETAQRLGIEREEGQAADSNPEAPPATESEV